MNTITLEQAQAMLPDIVRQLPPGEEITISYHEQHGSRNLGSR
jgi:antitoxin (DNA-binding transcriptional repressor) of toxin-antitoxin stability system